jgi:tetrachlorobenzoquinone reductase
MRSYLMAEQTVTAQLVVKPPRRPVRSESFRVRVQSNALILQRTLTVEFTSADGMELPAFSAGAHIDLDLPNGIKRSYSLCNAPTERGRYLIAVKKADLSRGGSAYIHEQLELGQVISISAPKNNFELQRNADMGVLIAGGIGVTPIWSMIQDLEARRLPWRLYYAARTRGDAAFLSEIRTLVDGRSDLLDIRFDHEPGVPMLDMCAIVADHVGAGVHFYCCGPGPMLNAFEAATSGVASAHAHLERFSAEPAPASAEALSEFDIVLARRGTTLRVEDGKTVLETLLDAGIDIAYSCMNGVCGSCRVEVLEGIPDHRDMVLTDDERASKSAIMVCCSRSRTPRLVFDL